MKLLKIKNFGPIQSGFDDIFMEIPSITILCGNQGTGKSTVAKLISTFSWIEKALIRGDFKERELTTYDHFRKKYCAFNNIQNYFKDNSELEYKGLAYNFTYKKKQFSIEKLSGKDYLMPQIMYVPAERNFMSAIEDAEKIRNLPNALATMIEEFEKAKKSFSKINLPVDGFSFQYDKLNKKSWLVGNDFKIALHEAASGFQSIVPLILVSKYLSSKINQNIDNTRSKLSVKEREHINNTIKDLLLDKSLDEDTRKSLLMQLNASFRNDCFLNIVEEPEQNLFPSSQRNILNELLAIVNAHIGNGLVITTHSPYMLNYISLSIKADMIKDKLLETVQKKLNDIVPLESCVHSEDVVIYELSNNGEIRKLNNFEGIPSDSNYLNSILVETNELYDKLLEYEDND